MCRSVLLFGTAVSIDEDLASNQTRRSDEAPTGGGHGNRNWLASRRVDRDILHRMLVVRRVSCGLTTHNKCNGREKASLFCLRCLACKSKLFMSSSLNLLSRHYISLESWLEIRSFAESSSGGMFMCILPAVTRILSRNYPRTNVHTAI